MSSFADYYTDTHNERYGKTLVFIADLIKTSDKILDIGPFNPFSKILKERGFNVQNTPERVDLDLEYEIVKSREFNVVIALEVFEHLVSPFPLLCSVRAPKLIASVPLRLWFSKAYWNENDPRDRHYHEFEPRQFDMLLNKAGWEIQKSDKWTAKTKDIGIRPLLRRFTPRYYIVYCIRSTSFTIPASLL